MLQLLARAVAAAEPEVTAAFANRAKRMHGDFLLSELARRGFAFYTGLRFSCRCREL